MPCALPALDDAKAARAATEAAAEQGMVLFTIVPANVIMQHDDDDDCQAGSTRTCRRTSNRALHPVIAYDGIRFINDIMGSD